MYELRSSSAMLLIASLTQIEAVAKDKLTGH